MARKNPNCQCANCGNLIYKKPHLLTVHNFCNRDCYSAFRVGINNTTFKDISGQKFGRLTAIKFTESRNNKAYWECRCDCGNIKEYAAIYVRSGNSKSCGCLKIDKQALNNYTHGKSDTVEFRIWCGIKNRCLNQKDKSYSFYGGRGITVCSRWLESFENFLSDMGKRPAPDLTLERKDNDGNYEKDNCRWATRTEQMNNTRTTRFITFQGETLPLSEWSRRMNISSYIVHGRLKNGWSVERALTEPLRK
jgi:hypothetical protein